MRMTKAERGALARQNSKLRKRGETQIRQLYGDYINMMNSPIESSYAERERRGEAIIEQIGRIRRGIDDSYLRGRGAAGERTAARAGETLARILGSPSRSTRAAATAGRRERVFSEALRNVRHGGTSAYFDEEQNVAPLESIFYAATQDLWAGLPIEERDAAIVKGLGMSTLEEAYAYVLAKNRRAIEAAADEGLMDDEDFMYMAYIVFVSS